MEHTYWHKQTKGNPLFPDLLWSRPENKNQAGRLLIIGGNLHGIAAPAEAYATAEASGIGVAYVLLPDAVQKMVGFLENAYFAPSTPSGSFAQTALAEMLDHSQTVDGVLLAGDVGRNAETAIALEKFVNKYSGLITITKDFLDYFSKSPRTLLERPRTTIVASLAQLQKLAQYSQFTRPITLGMDLINLVDALHEFTTIHTASVVTKYQDQLVVAHGGQVSTTKLTEDLLIWRVKAAATVAVWQLQNPSKTFEALTTAAFHFIQ
jgi:NAD(P)H-hydrate repair Nnr-like enzyme with NAD(P)H-hydrate dehydratase domain